MNMKNIFCCLLPGLLFGACSNKVYEKTGDSVIVKVQHKETGGPRLVRLQVMGDKLIHVSATADSKFADPQSLIVVPQKKQTSFAVVQNGDTLMTHGNQGFNRSGTLVVVARAGAEKVGQLFGGKAHGSGACGNLHGTCFIINIVAVEP